MAKRGSIGSLIGALFKTLTQGSGRKSPPRRSSGRADDGPRRNANGNRIYPVGLTGEKACQPAIRACREGEPVRLVHVRKADGKPGYIEVESRRGQVMGRIARGNWLNEAVIDTGRPVSARIMRIKGSGGSLGVVLDVVLEGEPIAVRDES